MNAITISETTVDALNRITDTILNMVNTDQADTPWYLAARQNSIGGWIITVDLAAIMAAANATETDLDGTTLNIFAGQFDEEWSDGAIIRLDVTLPTNTSLTGGFVSNGTTTLSRILVSQREGTGGGAHIGGASAMVDFIHTLMAKLNSRERSIVSGRAATETLANTLDGIHQSTVYHTDGVTVHGKSATANGTYNYQVTFRG